MKAPPASDRGHQGGQSSLAGNLVFKECLGAARHDCPLGRAYEAPDQADFRLRLIDTPLWRPLDSAATVADDFCGKQLPDEPNVGPLQYANGLDCLAEQPGIVGG